MTVRIAASADVSPEAIIGHQASMLARISARPPS